jgi:hypothetical protein
LCLLEILVGIYSPPDSNENICGCNDAGISDKADRYINQPEARPPLNSDEIMHGYTDGCSTSNNNSDAKDKNGTLTTLHNSCVLM